VSAVLAAASAPTERSVLKRRRALESAVCEVFFGRVFRAAPLQVPLTHAHTAVPLVRVSARGTTDEMWLANLQDVLITANLLQTLMEKAPVPCRLGPRALRRALARHAPAGAVRQSRTSPRCSSLLSSVLMALPLVSPSGSTPEQIDGEPDPCLPQ
jgi:hypothetical protein